MRLKYLAVYRLTQASLFHPHIRPQYVRLCISENEELVSFVHAVFGHSIVVYGTGVQSGQLLGCANIEPSLVAEEEIEISFPRNGTNPEDINMC